MKFGVFTVSMPEFTVEETVKTLAELGYDGVEWRVHQPSDEANKNCDYSGRYWAYNRSNLDANRIEEEALRAKQLCDQYNIEILSLTGYLEIWDTDGIKRQLHAARSIGCKQIRVSAPVYLADGNSADYHTLFSAARKQYEHLASLAKEYGVKIMTEIHMNNLLASPSAAYRMLEGLDPACVGVIFDPGNMVYEGFEDYRKSFELLGDYIAHVHIKNASLVQHGTDEFGAAVWKPAMATLKGGMADLGRLFRIMREYGYDSTIGIEDFSDEESPLDKLRHNLAYVKELYRAAQ